MKNKVLKIKVWLKIIFRLLLNPQKLFLSMDDFKFLSDEEVILFLKDNRVGLVRFGSGENGYLAGYPRPHQKHEKGLEKKIKDILLNYKKDLNENNYIVTVPLDIILGDKLEKRNYQQKVWRGAPKFAILPFLKKGHLYGSPFCFRLSNVICNDKEKYISLIKSLFEGRNIIYVGPEEKFASMFTPVKFIKIPPKDLFENFNELKKQIKEEAKKYEDPLVLITAGVAATAMSAELNDEEVLTYDVGSLLRWDK